MTMIRVHPNAAARIRELAEAEDRTMSAIVSRALAAYEQHTMLEALAQTTAATTDLSESTERAAAAQSTLSTAQAAAKRGDVEPRFKGKGSKPA